MAAPVTSLGCCRLLSFHEEMNPSKRKTMEDTIRVVDGFMHAPQNGYFAVFDGHGGRGVSAFLQDRLHKTLEAEAARKDGASMEELLERAFIMTDMDCCLEDSSENAGSTAALVTIVQEGTERVLYAANVGDSRVVLCKSGRASRLSQDHKAEDPDEATRIVQSGGFVIQNRVAGVLAVSRSFGDRSLKEWVIAKPFVSRTVLDEQVDFVILACDGVWDELDDQEAVNIVLSLEPLERPQAAKYLVESALEQGSCDNISAVVVFIK
ncbi:protein phosphatase 2C [Achlya hypogyna]|uniref:Protein phosphatase 2C n=1 Tax=Achlya hypogyna TaxID=1202772 RepID=A0A1V9ZFI7_ACHHY|nr:protein phosphatase 2C [Achlya hypogyna]